MKKSLAYLFTFIIFLGLGFFWLTINKKISIQKKSNIHQGEKLSIPQEYCLTQKGELVEMQSKIFCRINGIDTEPEKLMIENFSNVSDEFQQ